MEDFVHDSTTPMYCHGSSGSFHGSSGSGGRVNFPVGEVTVSVGALIGISRFIVRDN